MTIDERFSRHQYLPGWNQDRLAEAKVILVGVGALGNAVAQCLALAGVGTLVLCDPDWIEPSNLSRMPLFREWDIGHWPGWGRLNPDCFWKNHRNDCREDP